MKDKYGTLGIWDARAPMDEVEEEDVGPEQRETGKYWRLQVHWPATSQSSISCIKFDPIDAHSVSRCTLFAHSSPSSNQKKKGLHERV